MQDIITFGLTILALVIFLDYIKKVLKVVLVIYLALVIMAVGKGDDLHLTQSAKEVFSVSCSYAFQSMIDIFSFSKEG